MAKKRFSALDLALKALRSPTADSNDIVPDAPANSILRNYQEYKSGKRAVKYTRSEASNTDGLSFYRLKPFAFAAANTTEYAIKLSDRAYLKQSESGVTNDILGLAELGTTAYSEAPKGFQSAKVTIAIVGATAASKISEVTKKPYKTKTDRTYTYSFGRTTSNPSYAEQKKNIIARVQVKNEDYIVSFKPEIF